MDWNLDSRLALKALQIIYILEIKFGNTKLIQDLLNFQHIQKESRHGAVLGPFKSNPFQDSLIISPLNTVPKKDSYDKKIIMDLSYPKGNAVNDYIDKTDN